MMGEHMNREALKTKSSAAIASVLLHEAPLVREWLSSTDLNELSVERGRQVQAVIDAGRQPYIDALDECLDVMSPFALMATAFDREGTFVQICKRGVQSLTSSSLWSAREVWLRFRDAPDE